MTMGPDPMTRIFFRSVLFAIFLSLLHHGKKLAEMIAAIMERENLEKIAEIAVEKDIWVMSDEILIEGEANDELCPQTDVWSDEPDGVIWRYVDFGILPEEYRERDRLTVNFGVIQNADVVRADAEGVWVAAVRMEKAEFDFEIGNVVLNITDEIIIEDEEGNALKFEDITNENKLLVEYGPAMTMSLPPITNAVKIVKTAEIANELIFGKVEEVIFEEEKLTQIVISDEEENLTALNIGEETYVLNAEGEEGDLTKLEKGDEISGVVSAMSTRSIPPQKAAYKLRISK